MIAFKRISFWKRILLKISPKMRKKYDADLREAIEYLMAHPEAPCSIEGEIIPGGYGSYKPRKD